MKLGCIGTLLVVGGCIYCLAAGSTKVWIGATNRAPVSLTLAEFHDSRPSKNWLELTDCRVSLLEAMWSERDGKIEAVYIPLSTVGGPDDEQPQVVLESKTSDMLNRARSMRDMDETQLLLYMAKNADEVIADRSVSGLVSSWDDVDSETRGKLANLASNLGSNFVILQEGVKPSLGEGIGMIVAGIVLGVIFLGSVAGAAGQTEEQAEQEEEGEQEEAEA
jgi:hypothetical protein